MSVQTATQIRPFNEIPSPVQLPVLGHALNFASKNRLAWLSTLSDKYGPIVRLKFFQERVVVVQDPEWIRYILQSHYKDFSKRGRALEKGKAVLGNGLFTNEGEFWRKQRKLAQPAFYKRKLQGFAQIMVDCIESMLQEWEEAIQENPIIELAPEMMRLTLNVVTRAMFSSTLSDEEFEQISNCFPALLRETNRRILNPLVEINPFPGKDTREFEDNLAQLNGVIYRMIDEREASGKEYDDLLGLLMAAMDEESGESMSREQLRDEVVTIFIAGHETTAQALCWTLHLLDQNRGHLVKLEKEVEQVLGNDRQPTASDFRAMPYALKVFKESLRLYPPVAMYIRSSLKPFEMAGYQIPEDTRIIIPPYMLQRDPRYWDEAEHFDPERFSPEAEKARDKFVYFPFGGGPRICIGNNFAMMEAVFALAMIVQRFRLEVVEPDKVEIDFTLTLRPKGALAVRLLRK